MKLSFASYIHIFLLVFSFMCNWYLTGMFDKPKILTTYNASPNQILTFILIIYFWKMFKFTDQDQALDIPWKEVT